MAKPIPTPEQVAQLEKEKAKQEGFAAAFAAAAPAKQARAAELLVADEAFKDQFTWYNESIIAKYDAERKALDGQYIATPISEADVVGPATIDASARTTPSLPDTDIVRVAEFDGGPLINTDVNETFAIAEQANIEDVLVNGYGAGSGFNATTQTATALTAASTTLDVEDSVAAVTVSVNDVLVVKGVTEIAIIKITGITDNMGGDPPFEYTWDIEIIVPPSGTIAIGADFDSFTGFTNGERTTKTASDSDFQGLMDSLITDLEAQIAVRQARLAEQLAAIGTNDDPEGTAEFATATTNINTSDSFLTSYLGTTDISDTGLGTLSTERGVRGGQITARVAEIVAAYTGRSENFYDKRYSLANNRGNTARGTLRLAKATEEAAGQVLSYAGSAQDAADAMGDILS